MLYKVRSLFEEPCRVTKSVLAGGARDVSFLIDFLPAYLFPNGERTISTWAVAGVSLGGHSTWHCLKDGTKVLPSLFGVFRSSFWVQLPAIDPRVTIGIPIIGTTDPLSPNDPVVSMLTTLVSPLHYLLDRIFMVDFSTTLIPGCPDFLTLMAARARSFGDSTLKGTDPTGPPAFPPTLLSHIARTSPTPPQSSSSSNIPKSTGDDNHPLAYDPTNATDHLVNPFIGKKVLVLSGAADPLVPWSASQTFVDALQVGQNGRKEVFLQDGAKHECTSEMVERLARFIWEEALCTPSVNGPQSPKL